MEKYVFCLVFGCELFGYTSLILRWVGDDFGSFVELAQEVAGGLS